MSRVLVMSAQTSPDGETEAEPVLVEVHHLTIQLLLDDGTRLAFAKDELNEALSPSSTPPE